MSDVAPPRIVVAFATCALADRLVAGIPAGARALQIAVRMQAEAKGDINPQVDLCLALPGGVATDPYLLAEIARLVPDKAIAIVDSTARDWREGDQWLAGEALVSSPVDQLGSGTLRPRAMAVLPQYVACADTQQLARELDAAGRRIVAATIKPGDGLVSRHINRPVSMRISLVLLRFAAIRPLHATALTGLFGLLMALSLFSGTQTGLLVGGILFQVASIVDGVDGEIARATQRTSARGAMLDTVTDGITNVAFLAGLAFNLHQQGHPFALSTGMAGVICFASGLVLLGVNAARSGDTITFDAVKHYLNRNPTRISQILIWIAMRDFFALASMAFILMGFAFLLLTIFAAVAMGWLLVVTYIILSIKLKRV